MLALFIATTVFFVAVTFSPLKSGYADAPSRGPGDAALVPGRNRADSGRRVVLSGRQCRTARARLSTRSIFNWRMPLPVWLIGILPDAALGQALLGAMSLALFVLGFAW